VTKTHNIENLIVGAGVITPTRGRLLARSFGRRFGNGDPTLGESQRIIICVGLFFLGTTEGKSTIVRRIVFGGEDLRLLLVVLSLFLEPFHKTFLGKLNPNDLLLPLQVIALFDDVGDVGVQQLTS
jgi:hypothetical protein